MTDAAPSSTVPAPAASTIRVRPSTTPLPGELFELRNRFGDALGRVLRVDAVYRAGGRAMVIGIIQSGARAGESITVEFRDGVQTGARTENGLSDLHTVKLRAQEWQTREIFGEVDHG